MFAITRVILSGFYAEILRNCSKLIFHPVRGGLSYTDTGRHTVHEDTYGADNLLRKISS